MTSTMVNNTPEQRQILERVRELAMEPGKIWDGYHTFNELYEHRITLYIALLKQIYKAQITEEALVHCQTTGGKDGTWKREKNEIWRSTRHSDGTIWQGWFILGMFTEPGKQITYHLPLDKWDECRFAEILEQAPEFDGHTSADVLERLKNI